MSDQLYCCDGCSELIPAHKARLNCADCGGNHNVCTNCYVVGIYTQRHQQGHSVSLLVQSGYQPRIPSLPPRPRAVAPGPAAATVPRPVIQPVLQNRPISQQAAPSSPNVQRQVASPPVASPPIYQRQTVPPSAASYKPNVIVPAVVQYPAQPGWQPLFQESAPTAIMETFLNVVFTCLDTNKDGYLTPEEYSAFLDVQEYGPDEDVWKKNHKELPMYTADDVADFELKMTYENFSIDHKMQPRPNATTSTYMADLMATVSLDPSIKQLMIDSSEKKSFTGGMMPMLSRRGFIDITVIEILYEPSPGWLRVNRIARHYNIWRQWGDVPRSMMPLAPPNELVTRVAIIHQQAAAKAQSMVDASALQAAMQAQTNENILRLFDPPGTRYVYR